MTDEQLIEIREIRRDIILNTNILFSRSSELFLALKKGQDFDRPLSQALNLLH